MAPPGADHQRASAGGSPRRDRWPTTQHCVGEVVRGGEPAPVRPYSDEIRVAELAYRLVAVLLTPRPEVAAAEPAEHGGSARVLSFALKGVEDLLDDVGHA